MVTSHRRSAAAVLVLLVALWGCPGNDRDDEVAATPAEHLTPEQQMQTALQRLVEAQARYFQDHNSYTDSLQTLIDEYDFVPVGDATVAVNFAGTQAQWGYVGTAIHPFSNQQCEVLHGRATDGRPFAGQIECSGPEQRPPTPQTIAPGDTLITEVGPGGATPGQVAAPPGQTPDAQRATPPAAVDTLPPQERRP